MFLDVLIIELNKIQLSLKFIVGMTILVWGHYIFRTLVDIRFIIFIKYQFSYGYSCIGYSESLDRVVGT